jgi:hypothetical protein
MYNMNSPLRSTLFLLILTSLILTGLSTFATEPVGSSDKPAEGWYLGGTSGRSGIDSVRGFVDSIFYAKAALRATQEMIGEPEGVIYGDDDRRDIYTLTDPNLLNLAQAVCVIVESYEISNNGNGTYTLNTVPWTTQGGYPLCSGERFAGQRTIGFCSGFLVGNDIIVTAGHCVDACTGVAFVFGFQQVDSLTPPLTVVPADNVYFCSDVIDQRLEGDYDHSVVRLDRPVVGRAPIPIRRDGLVDNGAPLVLVGHPTGLPMKAAAGAEVKNSQPSLPWFQANTDSYGGNSGSMVVNTNTWEIEGILVRGAPDFVYSGGCARSNVVPNSGNPGSGLEFEEISKITTVAEFIPSLIGSAGVLTLGADFYTCSGNLTAELRDLDLAGSGTQSLTVSTSGTDVETMIFTESSTPGSFAGTIPLASNALNPGDGVLRVADGEIVTLVYEDADQGGGVPATVTATATIDCQTPQISAVAVDAVGASWVRVTFTTNELSASLVRVGTTCGTYLASGTGTAATSHVVTVSGLSPSTPYRFYVAAIDRASNVTVEDNSGACYEFTTSDRQDYFTQQFTTGCDIVGKTLALVPDGSADYYYACLFDSPEFLAPTTGQTTLTLGDDDYAEVNLNSGRQVSLYGVPYSTVFIGSNGYVTFGEGDTDWSETLDEHLAAPPRISVFWDDLDPSAGGTVGYQQLDDRLVVTWSNVPGRLSSASVSVQLALHFDGSITMTYPLVQQLDGIIGISAGTGTPTDFAQSDLSQLAVCQYATCYPDVDGDQFGDDGDPGIILIDGQCPAGTVNNALDCDDADPLIHPGVVDVPDDAIDQNCDGRDASCCLGKVGDVNDAGGDEPTIGDVSVLIDHLFVTGVSLGCLQEADVNQSGGRYPIVEDITIGDISVLIDHLFISGVTLNDCL